MGKNFAWLGVICVLLLLAAFSCSQYNGKRCNEKYGVGYGFDQDGYASCVDVDGNRVGYP